MLTIVKFFQHFTIYIMKIILNEDLINSRKKNFKHIISQLNKYTFINKIIIKFQTNSINTIKKIIK